MEPKFSAEGWGHLVKLRREVRGLMYEMDVRLDVLEPHDAIRLAGELMDAAQSANRAMRDAAAAELEQAREAKVRACAKVAALEARLGAGER